MAAEEGEGQGSAAAAAGPAAHIRSVFGQDCDLYAVLGLDKSASAAQVKKAYYGAALKWVRCARLSRVLHAYVLTVSPLVLPALGARGSTRISAPMTLPRKGASRRCP